LRYIFTTYIFVAVFFNNLSAQPDSKPVDYFNTKFSPVEKTIYYRLGDKTTIPVIISQYGDNTGIVYVNVHDSEPTSVMAAKKILETAGGIMIKIENRGKRNIQFRLKNVSYSFDPNRIFHRTGIEQTLKINGRVSNAAITEIEKFGQRLLQLMPAEASCIVALHNNTDGAFSIKSYLPSGDRTKDAKAVYANKQQDIDDIALTTDSLLYQKMADCGYNSIWQDNKKAKRDGSLSIYCGENNLRYINIETQHGNLELHIQMLQKLMAILRENKDDDSAVKTEIAEN
jgi:hypothetical protein